MTMRLQTLCLLLFLCVPLGGCSFLGMGVQVETTKTSVAPPSNISVYLTVKNAGEPVGYLTASDFQIYENDVLLDNSQIGFRLLPRDNFGSGATVVILDLSDNPDKNELHRISRGAAHFVEKVSTSQQVIVIAFDGSERPRKVAEFPRVSQETKRPLPELSKFLTKDSSRDLNSAIVAAANGLKQTLAEHKSEVQFGTIVTLTRGQDLAGRTSEADVKQALKDSGFEMFSISPEGASLPELELIGSEGRIEYDTIDTLPLRFQDLGMRVRDGWFSHYLLSYCSPARAGTRQLKVRVEFEDDEGVPQSGSSHSEFNASGFQGGCVAAKQSAKEEAAATDSGPSESTGEVAPTIEPEPQAPASPAKKRQPKKATPQTKPKKAPPESSAPVVAPPPSGKYE